MARAVGIWFTALYDDFGDLELRWRRRERGFGLRRQSGGIVYALCDTVGI